MAWAASVIWFWVWWFTDRVWASTATLMIASGVVAFAFLLPAYHLAFVWRACRPHVRHKAVPERWRVAMVVTKAPSEPWPLVRSTLEAMLDQDFDRRQYDVWLADEEPTEAVRAWCDRRGVRISSRFGVPGYHQTSWPRRTRCKEGNLAYFYDRWGYDDYDVVAQFDADHRPAPNYLSAVLPAFEDPRVGYVAMPSICDSNAAESWAARGRLFAEAALHGPVQTGSDSDLAPTCFGSHYAIRTSALRQIGGLGPELAEDFTTTFFMNAYGWEGAFAHDAIAHGDGPASVADAIVQEMQWSKSMTLVLLRVAPPHWGRMRASVRAKLAFNVIWYPVQSVHRVVSMAMCPLALVIGIQWARVPLVEFAAHVLLPAALMVVLASYERARGWLRPSDSPVVSWECALFRLAVWPWAAVGVLAGVLGAITGRSMAFRVTPKGDERPLRFPMMLLAPYLGISVGMSAVVVGNADAGDVSGYYVLCLLIAFCYGAVAVMLVELHRRENPGLGRRVLFGLFSLSAAVIGVAVAAVFVRLDAIEEVVARGAIFPLRENGSLDVAGVFHGPAMRLALVACAAGAVSVLLAHRVRTNGPASMAWSHPAASPEVIDLRDRVLVQQATESDVRATNSGRRPARVL